ncbi:MAG: restriction endonuclease subunit S [Bacteroidales bacterium]|nr:restriction endonuclease subunit S [Bacteroidales bacterium]
MALSKYKLGELIQQRREKYNGAEELSAWGVSKEGFISPKQEGADTSIYNVFYKNDFVFNPARMELNSIALNLRFDKAICSSLYEVFYITKTNIVLPEYLNLYIKRDEFARKCWFEAIGSARNYFRVGNLSEFDIDLPSLDIQQKYVDVYNAMLANQQTYERGLEDLKLVCDGYIEDLRRKMPCEKIGGYIRPCDERNSDLKIKLAQGITNDKEFANPKQVADAETSAKIVRKGQFAYNRATTRNGEKISIAYRTGDDCVVSSAYQIFEISVKDKLYPEYLMMWYKRSEFDRYARYMSKGSAHEFFEYEDMEEVEVPIPDIEIQKSIVNIYNCYIERKRINEQLKAQIKDICPILIKGSIEEGRKERK